MTIRVLVADDHAVVRSGLGQLLATAPDLEPAGEASDGQEAIAMAEAAEPDVILMGISMPVLVGVEATRRIVARDPEARIVMLTSMADNRKILDALEAGASGYLLKHAGPDELLGAIRAAAAGEAPLDPFRLGRPALRAGRPRRQPLELPDRRRRLRRARHQQRHPARRRHQRPARLDLPGQVGRGTSGSSGSRVEIRFTNGSPKETRQLPLRPGEDPDRLAHSPRPAVPGIGVASDPWLWRRSRTWQSTPPTPGGSAPSGRAPSDCDSRTVPIPKATSSASSPPDLSGMDQSVFEWFVEHREPWLTTVMRLVTLLGGSAFLIPLGLALGGWFRWRSGTWRPLAQLASAYLGALVLSNSIKALVGRGRPPAAAAIGVYDSPSFPSGHATHAAAVWIMVGVITAAAIRDRRRRVAVWIAVGAVVGLVGVTRLYLAAHWLSDVLAGWAVGGLWAVLVTVFTSPSLRKPRK